MGKKGKNVYQERPQSTQELQLLNTQNQQLQAAIDVAKQQDNRAAEQYRHWQNAYQPIETGMIMQGASRANGYSDPAMVAAPDSRNLLFKSRQAEYDRYGGTGQYQSQGGEAPVESYYPQRTSVKGA